MKAKKPYVWCLFYITKEYSTINTELQKKGYTNIKALVPTISILKKRSKGRDIYEEVPLLFSYGFIRMPSHLAYDRAFLNKLKKDIQGIHVFIKSTNSLFPKKLKKRTDGEEFDDFSIVSTVPSSDVRRFKRIAKNNQVYRNEEISSLAIGTYVILRGYPFEGVDATIEEVNLVTKTVTVCLYPNNGSMEVMVPLENVAYSIYHNYDENKLYANSKEFNPDLIQGDMIDELINKKQY